MGRGGERGGVAVPLPHMGVTAVPPPPLCPIGLHAQRPPVGQGEPGGHRGGRRRDRPGGGGEMGGQLGGGGTWGAAGGWGAAGRCWGSLGGQLGMWGTGGTWGSLMGRMWGTRGSLEGDTDGAEVGQSWSGSRRATSLPFPPETGWALTGGAALSCSCCCWPPSCCVAWCPERRGNRRDTERAPINRR